MKLFNYLSDKCRTVLLCSTADSDDIIPAPVKILRDILRIMTADVNSYFGHHFDGKRVDLRGRSYSGRADLGLGMKVLKDSVGHLAAASVAGT